MLLIALWQDVLLMAKVYLEKDLVIAVWANPKKRKGRPNARLLETMTSDKSSYPLAFPLETLQKIQSWMYCLVATTSIEAELYLTPEHSSRENPILIPISLAKSYLGWQDFYILTDYLENK